MTDNQFRCVAGIISGLIVGVMTGAASASYLELPKLLAELLGMIGFGINMYVVNDACNRT